MTSKLTRLTDEELAEIAFYAGESTCHPDPNYQLGFESLATGSSVLSIVRELQERRKADSEPVAEVLSNRPGNDTSTIDRALPVGTQLYRHAQQPVVPPMQHWEELCREYPDMSIGDAIIRAAWWNHCRAAMLNGGKP
ncbi:hypothetical protein [Raoultella planticola]|uniref:hypothetical protein n=1 Tax=Raoultella planticola TaxID=575 RepID=UPI00388EC9D7